MNASKTKTMIVSRSRTMHPHGDALVQFRLYWYRLNCTNAIIKCNHVLVQAGLNGSPPEARVYPLMSIVQLTKFWSTLRVVPQRWGCFNSAYKRILSNCVGLFIEEGLPMSASNLQFVYCLTNKNFRTQYYSMNILLPCVCSR